HHYRIILSLDPHISSHSSLFTSSLHPPPTTATYTLSLHDALPIYPNEGNETEVQGNATPASSPQDTDPAGNVEEYGEISDIAHVGDTISVRSDDTITFGAPDSLGNPLKISPSCGDLHSSAGFFFIGCGDKVYKIDARNPSDPRVIPVDVDFAVTAATELSSGELFLASNETKDIVIYKDGEVIDDFTVEEPSDQL